MENNQFIVALDANARFVHLFLHDKIELPIPCDDLVGEPLGKYAPSEEDSRLLRSTFAECLFTAEPQECEVVGENGYRYHFRFERVVHQSAKALRTEDEVVVISVITRVPDEVELTMREKEIVRLVCRDLSSAEIGERLGVKASTVETHRQNIRQKLGVKGNAGLVLYAVRQGLLE